MLRRAYLGLVLGLVLTSCPGCYASQCLPGEVPVTESRVLTEAIAGLPTVPRGGVSAVTIGRHVFVHPDAAGDRVLLCHELEHVAQYDSLGALFFFEYSIETLRNGYQRNRFELAADSAAANGDC